MDRLDNQHIRFNGCLSSCFINITMGKDLIIMNRVMLIIFTLSLILVSVLWIIGIMKIDKALPAIIILNTGVLYTGYMEILIQIGKQNKTE